MGCFVPHLLQTTVSTVARNMAVMQKCKDLSITISH